MPRKPTGGSRQDRSGLARIVGAGKKQAKDLPKVPVRKTYPKRDQGKGQTGKGKSK